MFEGYGLHSKAKFLDEKKQSKFLANLEGLTVLGKILKADPFKKLLSTVNFSAESGSAGPRAKKFARITDDDYLKENISRMYEEIGHDNSTIDIKTLEEIFVRQDGKCYWSQVPLIPETNGTTGYSLSMSPDRLNNDYDYTIDNIVITTQLVNRGRCNINPEDFAWQSRQMGWEPMWFNDPRRAAYLKEYSIESK